MTPEQQLAIDKKNGNILVSASAGSGKTTVLIARVINKVIKYKVDVDRLAILTFTNAAASELKERLLFAIYEEIKKEPENMFLKRQIININRANISTIHAFCLNVIKQNFSILGLDPAFKIGEDSRLGILKEKAMNKVIEDRYLKYNESIIKNKDDRNSKDNIDEYINEIIEYLGGSEENLVGMIYKTYSFIQSFPYPMSWLKEQIEKYNITDLNQDIVNFEYGKKTIKTLNDEIVILLSKLNEFKELYLRENKVEDVTKYIEIIDEDIFKLNSVINNTLKFDIVYSNLKDISFSNFPRAKMQNEELRQNFMNFRNKYMKESIKKQAYNIYAPSQKILEDTQHMYKYVKYIYDLIFDFDLEYTNLKKEEGVIDFNDIEHFALELLYNKEDNTLTDICNNLQKKFDEVYVDEYQDTSYVQEAIIEAISGKKNRFLVGDIKQSIYKFRQAMPDIFISKYDEYKTIHNINNASEDEYSTEKIILAKNFRSRPQVISYINYVFEKIMSKELGECSYEGEEVLEFGATYYLNNENNKYMSEVNIINRKKEEENIEKSDDENYDSVYKEEIEELKSFELESKHIANKIKEILNDKEFLVQDKETKKLRRVQNKDIVILLRSIKSKGNILEEELKKMNILAFCDASTNVFDSDEINLILSLLRVIDNPMQDIPLVSIMYSIIGKFSLDELAYISKYKEKYLYDALKKIYTSEFVEFKELEKNVKNKDMDYNKEIKEFENIKKKVVEFLDLIYKLQENLSIYPLPTYISKIYEDTNIYYQMYLNRTYKQNIANLDYLIKLAINFENMTSKQTTSIYSFIQYVDNIKLKGVTKDSSSAKIIGENEDVVRIMTIHKSKGLEFPVVILADTTSKYNLKDTSDSYILHHKLGLGVNIYDNELKSVYPSVQKLALKNEIINESKSEELRMLYVALTRAREKLIVFATVNDFKKLKDNQNILYKDSNIIDSISIKQNNSYFKNILMAMSKDLKLEDGVKEYNVNNVFKVNILDKEDEEKVINNEKENNKYIFGVSLEEKIKELKNCYNKDKVKKENETIENETIENVIQNIEYNYENEEDTYTDLRVSVSKIKKEKVVEKEKNITNLKNTYEFELKLPKSLNSKKEKLSATKRGTLNHYILQYIDIYKINTKEEILEYAKDKLKNIQYNEEIKEIIDIEGIYNFLNSEIVVNIRKLPKENLKREQEFIFIDKEISKSQIQGIIDMYYIKQNGKITLVDYKTDKLNNEEEFIKRYKLQLDIYKKALEKITKKEVDEVYIYSFNLKKYININ